MKCERVRKNCDKNKYGPACVRKEPKKLHAELQIFQLKKTDLCDIQNLYFPPNNLNCCGVKSRYKFEFLFLIFFYWCVLHTSYGFFKLSLVGWVSVCVLSSLLINEVDSCWTAAGSMYILVIIIENIRFRHITGSEMCKHHSEKGAKSLRKKWNCEGDHVHAWYSTWNRGKKSESIQISEVETIIDLNQQVTN